MESDRFAIRVRPGARRTSVGGSRPGARGPALLVSVTAPAVDGRANDAVCAAIAAAFGVRARHVTIVSGPHARDKIVEVRPWPPDGAAILAALLEEETR